MDFYKKRRIKERFKEHWKAIVATSAFVLSAAIVMLVGFAMNGWSIVRWIKSPFGTTFIIMIVFGIIGGFAWFYVLRIIKKKKGY